MCHTRPLAFLVINSFRFISISHEASASLTIALRFGLDLHDTRWNTFLWRGGRRREGWQRERGWRDGERGLWAFRRDSRARGTSAAHRPGQEAARMEIRPDRFKAAAGKTLGKIHRYTHFKYSAPEPLTSPRFWRVCSGRLGRVGRSAPDRDFRRLSPEWTFWCRKSLDLNAF